MAKFERSAILKKFRTMAARGEPIAVAARHWIVGHNARKPAGVDLIVIYNSGRYRSGRGSLAGMMAYAMQRLVVEMPGGSAPGGHEDAGAGRRQRHDPFRDMDLSWTS